MGKILIAGLLASAVIGLAATMPTKEETPGGGNGPPEQVVVKEPEVSKQAQFAADHPDESSCAAPAELEERLTAGGATLVSDDFDRQVWMAKDGSRIFVEASPMEACIVS